MQAGDVGEKAPVELFSSVDKIEWCDTPVLVKGPVQRGFGRGSRQLGTPTANLPGHLLDGIAQADRDGVYLGYGVVPSTGRKPAKMVASLGKNITYGDVKERVLEAYLMDDALPEEFYGEEMRLCIGGFMRHEVKFDGFDALIQNIKNDVNVASDLLDTPTGAALGSHQFLVD